MNKQSVTINRQQSDWHRLTGELSFRVNNDYLFRALLQTDNDILKEMIASLLHWDPRDIVSAVIQNPIVLGDRLKAKHYILDVKVLLNNNIIMNLEMQIVKEENWPERSLCYLCRIFDRLNRGDDYTNVKPAYQIGFTEFAPIPEYPEFHATYRMLNTKSYHEYTDKFTLSVVDLSHIELATDEDRSSKLDQWAGMFKAKTWEELRMLAQENPVIDQAVTRIHELTEEDIIREQMEMLEESYRVERGRMKRLQMAEEQVNAMTERANAEAERANAEAERANAEAERANAEAERANTEAERANTEAERANTEAERANTERERANANEERARQLEQELAEKDRLIAELRAKQNNA